MKLSLIAQPARLRRKPFIAIPDGLAEDVLSRRPSGRSPAVYVWLRLLADRAGVVHTSAARLAGELRFRTAMIERDLNDLERAEYIHAEHATRRGALAAIVVVR